jgi:hypothetical protein
MHTVSAEKEGAKGAEYMTTKDLIVQYTDSRHHFNAWYSTPEYSFTNFKNSLEEHKSNVV